MTEITFQDRAVLRAEAAEADVNRAITANQLALIHGRQWFSVLAPGHCGGGELTIPDAVRLFESIARADGSVGWLVTLCAGAGWFGGFLPAGTAREVIMPGRCCLAGSGAPSGSAERLKESYRVSGQWSYATGADIATHFTFNAVVQKGSKNLPDPDGNPATKAFLVPAGQVRVIPDWKAVRLCATSTHSFAVANLCVSAGCAFTIDGASATSDGPLYQFPFLPLALASFAANISGIAYHFAELASAIIAERRHPLNARPLIDLPEIQARLTAAQRALAEARERFYAGLEVVWERVVRGDAARVEGEAFRALALALVAGAQRMVDDLYPLCGLRAAAADSEINRVWRDFHTATQHALLLP